MYTEHHHSSPTRHHGFTLIEVIAVIAIIGILASVTLASLSGARENPRDKFAISTMQSIIIQASLYRANHANYSGLCAHATITDLFDDINDAVGATPSCITNPTTGYEMQLLLLSGQTYCIDSSKFFGHITLPIPNDNNDC